MGYKFIFYWDLFCFRIEQNSIPLILPSLAEQKEYCLLRRRETPFFWEGFQRVE